MERNVDYPKIVIICAIIVLAIAGCLSLMSPKQQTPVTDEVCAALRAAPPDASGDPFSSWDNPHYRLLCADSGGGR